VGSSALTRSSGNLDFLEQSPKIRERKKKVRICEKKFKFLKFPFCCLLFWQAGLPATGAAGLYFGIMVRASENADFRKKVSGNHLMRWCCKHFGG
jgi:hypothetical protein